MVMPSAQVSWDLSVLGLSPDWAPFSVGSLLHPLPLALPLLVLCLSKKEIKSFVKFQ